MYILNIVLNLYSKILEKYFENNNERFSCPKLLYIWYFFLNIKKIIIYKIII